MFNSYDDPYRDMNPGDRLVSRIEAQMYNLAIRNEPCSPRNTSASVLKRMLGLWLNKLS